MIKYISILWGHDYSKVLDLNVLAANNKWAYIAKGSGEVLGGPQQTVFVSEPRYSTPYETGSKLMPRLFTIRVTINGWAEQGGTPDADSIYGWQWHKRRHDLLKALYNGPIRVVFTRWHPTLFQIFSVYLEGSVESSPETEPGVFELHIIAANPHFVETSETLHFPPPPEGRDQDGQIESLQQQAVNQANSDPGSIDPADWMTLHNRHTFNTGDPSSTDLTDSYSPPLISYIGSAPTEPTIIVDVAGLGSVWRYFREFSVTNPAPVALNSYPVCIDLGDVSAMVTAGKIRADYADIRLETFAAVQKPIYVRPYPDRTVGPSVKVWFVVHALQPGETKYLRLFYGRQQAVADPENFYIKPMFSMYDSTNASLQYRDFMPRYDQSQSRVLQWTSHLQNNINVAPLTFSHPSFAPPSDPTLVAQAGAWATFYGQGAGYAGLELSLPIPISSLIHTYKTRTTYKAPFVQRSRGSSGRWVDNFADTSNTGNSEYTSAIANAGATTIQLVEPIHGGWLIGDTFDVALDNGVSFGAVITNIRTGGGYSGTFFDFTPAIPAGRIIPGGAKVFQNTNGHNFGSRTQTFPTGDEPRSVALGFRVDRPDQVLGNWYFCGAEDATVNLVATQTPYIRWRSGGVIGPFDQPSFVNGFEFDLQLDFSAYQLRGRIQNSADGTFLRVNYILKHRLDRLVIDCEHRTCTYYEWDATLLQYNPPVNAYTALYFDEVRDFWLRLNPDQDENSLIFVHDAESNFRNLLVTMVWKNRYL